MKNTKQTSQSVLRQCSSLSRYRTLNKIGKGKNFMLKKTCGFYKIVKKVLLAR